MTVDVVREVGTARFDLGVFIGRAVSGDTDADEVTALADKLDQLAKALRVTAGTMQHREAADG